MKKILFFHLVLGLLMLMPESAFGCSCYRQKELTREQDIKRMLKRASVIFAGKVKSIELRGRRQTVKFDVLEYWKGVRTREIIVEADIFTGGNCGFNFKVNETYLVYSYMNRGRLETNNCTYTAPLAWAQSDLEVLGKGKTLTSQK